MQLNNWLSKSLPPPTPPESLLPHLDEVGSQRSPTVMHMDIEKPSAVRRSLQYIRVRKSAIAGICFRSALIALGAIILISLVSYVLTGLHGPGEAKIFAEHHDFFVAHGCNSTIAKHLKELTKEPHVAGTAEDMKTADYVLTTFRNYGLAAHYRDYEVLLSYPLKRSLLLTLPNGSIQTLSLTEKPAEGDIYSTSAKVIPAFHAYAPSGTAVGDAIYVNYGREEDYRKLEELGINANGSVVIARYGETYRGDIVANAAKAGANAVILYSDPKDFADGKQTGFYPLSKWLTPTGIQRGTVLEGIGDPLTPGWPSTPNSERLTDSEVASRLPRIPSLPISAEDALHILGSLGGPLAPPEWHGSLPLPGYRIGEGPGKITLSYEANQTVVTIRNVFAVIKGSEDPDRYVFLGNHRDAWTFGAVDPNSGTAALLEISRRLGKLLRRGWHPRRSIILCSWDAEEYGMVGSTEWVEQNKDNLAFKAVAYLNVDSAVAGPGFFAASTPQLDRILIEVTKQIRDPDSFHSTIYDSWAASSTGQQNMITRLGGGGSDFMAFLQHVGIPSMDMYFGKDYPVYHSLYDNYHWMETFGDPLFQRHVAISAVWGLVALRLADDAIIPFDFTSYVHELQMYANQSEQKLSAAGSSWNTTVVPLYSAIKAFTEAVTQLAEEVALLSNVRIDQKTFTKLGMRRRILNDRLVLAERALLDSDGLKGRRWYKHLVFSSSRSNGYSFTSFPGIDDATSDAVVSNDSKGWLEVQHEIWRVSRVIHRAALVLKGEFT